MKKFFSFAIALVACAMTFISCETKIDSPLVESWNRRGTLVEVDAETGTSVEYSALFDLYFFDNGQWQYNIHKYDAHGDLDINNGYIKRGTWSVKGDKITLRTQQSGKIVDRQPVYDTSFKPTTEEITWRIDGHNLHLTFSDGHEEVYYDGKF